LIPAAQKGAQPNQPKERRSFIMANTSMTSKPDPATAPAALEPPAEAFLCSIHNPTVRPRNIFDGIKNDKPIHIEPRQTVQAVLGPSSIDRLEEAAEHATPDDPVLQVTVLGPPPPAPPPRAARRARPVGGATA
jgi:hypothetical protein